MSVGRLTEQGEPPNKHVLHCCELYREPRMKQREGSDPHPPLQPNLNPSLRAIAGFRTLNPRITWTCPLLDIVFPLNPLAFFEKLSC
jgi:hypothetical protein